MHTREREREKIEQSGAMIGDGPDHEPVHRQACSPEPEHVATKRLHIGALKAALRHNDVNPKEWRWTEASKSLSTWCPSWTMTVDPVMAESFTKPDVKDNRGPSMAARGESQRPILRVRVWILI
jgi:hypothetical protein